MPNYFVNQRNISALLQNIKDEDIVIPEIQRPFVWESKKVRNLMDSLYQEFPIGYIITWKNPNIRLKNGRMSEGKQVIIDGQQRITALMAAILGREIIDKEYQKKRIRISFNPLKEKFETLTPVIEKNSEWISDISEFFKTRNNIFNFTANFCKKNNFTEKQKIKTQQSLTKLLNMEDKFIGIIELDANLDIDDVTEIFVRINDAGTPLSQADFAMSKIASYEPTSDHLFGVNLRKSIDYFAHLSQTPHFLEDIGRNDKEFSRTEYLLKMKWAGKELDNIYNPNYKDILRVSFIKEFNRGKISDLVKLLSGQNFKTRNYDQKIQEKSFLALKNGVLDFINENHFKKFLIILQSAGIIDSKLINSQSVLNFAYIVYLKLRKDGMANNLIGKYTKKWLVLSILTERYSASPESTMDKDIKDINKYGIKKVIAKIEEADMSSTYWNIGLVQNLNRAIISSPFLSLFFIAQICSKDKALFSESVLIDQLVSIKGDVHHIFPKNYLQKAGFGISKYNQIANFVYLQQEVNITIGDKPPGQYFSRALNQCDNKTLDSGSIGEITDKKKLIKNLEINSIPTDIFEMDITNYDEFLEKRRKLMAKKIEKFYKSL
ncbi:MAG: DUF262 domain-containing protein [Patescibacteria group bacterium]|nr:DUF262 domain-containing protein [Patescibacteria group bacterium]MEA3497281.1 DUF262 domain-containing protein [Bacteroidota bacterium]